MLKMTMIGNLARNPESKSTQKGDECANFSVGANVYEKGERRSEYVSCTAFGQTARVVLQYMQKGSGIYVEGRPSVFVGRDGKAHISMVVDRVEFVGGKNGGEPITQDAPVQNAPVRSAAPVPSDGVDVTAEFLRTGKIEPPAPQPVENVKLPWDDDDVPF